MGLADRLGSRARLPHGRAGGGGHPARRRGADAPAGACRAHRRAGGNAGAGGGAAPARPLALRRLHGAEADPFRARAAEDRDRKDPAVPVARRSLTPAAASEDRSAAHSRGGVARRGGPRADARRGGDAPHAAAEGDRQPGRVGARPESGWTTAARTGIRKRAVMGRERFQSASTALTTSPPWTTRRLEQRGSSRSARSR